MRLARWIALIDRGVVIAAYIIIGGWAIRATFQSHYDTASLAVPLVLGLTVLIEIRKQLRNELPTRRVGTFPETVPMIREAFERELKKCKVIEVRILGQTMQSYLPFLRPLIQELIDKNPGVQFTIIIAMIDPKGDYLGPGLADAAIGSLKELKKFAEGVQRNLVNTLIVFTYKDAPAITGIAINHAALFFGMIKYKKVSGGPAKFEMSTTTGVSSVFREAYEMVRAVREAYDIYRDSRPEDEERIGLFVDSFDALCARSKPFK
jgi:hypothetical protein